MINVNCIEISLVIFTELTCCTTHEPIILTVLKNQTKMLIPKTKNINQCCPGTKDISWNKREKLCHAK